MERGRRARSCGCRCCHSNRGTGCGDLKVRQASRVPARGPKPVRCLTAVRWCFSTWGGIAQGELSFPYARQGERGTSPTSRKWHGGSLGHPAHRPPGSGRKASVPPPHCPQILLQPLPQPLCRNERSRTSRSRRSISHCPSGTSLETRRTSAPWVRGRACTRLSAGQGLGENEVRGRRLQRKEEGRTRGGGVGRGGRGGLLVEPGLRTSLA